MKYSSRQRSHIFPPTDITLFRGKSNNKKVPFKVRFDGIRHYPLSIQLNVVVIIMVNSRNMFARNVLLNFTLIVLKVTIKM